MNPITPPPMPTTSWQFWGFLAFLVYQAVMATLSYLQNRKQITNQEEMKVNQEDMKVAVNGHTQMVVDIAHALGQQQGTATEKAANVEERLREIRGNGS